MKTFSRCSVTLGFLFVLVSPCIAQVKQLPDGPFTLVAGNDNAVNFIVDNSVVRSGDQVRLTTYRVYARPIAGPGDSIDQELTDLRISCSERTYRSAEVNGFRSDGQWVAYFTDDQVQPIEPRQTWEFIALIACGEARMPDHMTVDGAAAARQMGLARLR